jgi:hypothetical protein
MELKDYLNSINNTKESVMTDEISEKNYPAYVVNRCLSYFPDTVHYANVMNKYNYILDNKLQYDFYIYSIRKRKRFSPWIKNENNENLEAVKEYYGYSNTKAYQALTILSDEDLEYIKKKLFKGGIDKN